MKQAPGEVASAPPLAVFQRSRDNVTGACRLGASQLGEKASGGEGGAWDAG